MAAALLMMNMQGAVMAADKDQTIFRYSDKVPFALMINPDTNIKCKQFWENVWNSFRKSDIEEDDYLTSFIQYLEDTISETMELPDEFVDETFILLRYQKDQIFPEAKEYHYKKVDDVLFDLDETDNSTLISTLHPIGIHRLGSFEHTRRLIDGEISDKEKEILKKTSAFLDNFNPKDISPINKLLVSIKLDDIKQQIQSLIQKYKQKRMDGIAKAICSSHIEDMIRMAENVIDAEGQQHKLQHPEEALESTKEIATLTLAEGFRWIKHSLYGAV